MKKILLVLTILLAAYSSASLSRELTLAYVDFPPYEYQGSDNQPKGVLVDIVKTIFQRANIPVNFKFLPFKRALEEVKDGTVDGLFNFYKTEERLPLFDFSESIISNPLVLFVRQDSQLTFNGSLNDLKGKTIGAMLGYTYGSEFDSAESLKVERIASHEANFKKLAYARIDAYPCDRLVGIHILRKENMREIKILPIPMKVMEGHIGFAKGKNLEAIGKINAVIAAMKKNREIDGIINKYVEGL